MPADAKAAFKPAATAVRDSPAVVLYWAEPVPIDTDSCSAEDTDPDASIAPVSVAWVADWLICTA